jgi:hypothetical protein
MVTFTVFVIKYYKILKNFIWLYTKRKLSHAGIGDNPIRGRVKLLHKGA